MGPDLIGLVALEEEEKERDVSVPMHQAKASEHLATRQAVLNKPGQECLPGSELARTFTLDS